MKKRLKVHNPGLERGKPVDPDLAVGLTALHERMGTRIVEEKRLSAQVYALTELLVAKGVIGLRELEDRKAAVEQQMAQEAETKWLAAEIATDESDKYQAPPVEIDCESRLHLCKAACCRLTFHLSKQDIQEGLVRWDVGRPFQIAQREDGWCAHCDKQTKKCNVHAHRPLVCRQYDCRDDSRIWEDFEQGIPNPDLAKLY
jgi:Fe-S-cluster containining protein